MERMSAAAFDQSMMESALICAQSAAEKGEVPIGAVLVDRNGTILASAANDCIAACDPVGHAEIRVLRAAAQQRGNYRLPETTLYVTLEPCAMCAAAMVHARISRLVFGAPDPKAGGVVSRYSIGHDGQLNHTYKITGGVLADQCSLILKEFFQSRR